MARILVVYASQHGQAEKIARHAAHALEEAGHESALMDAERAPSGFGVSKFQSALIVAPIHAGGYPRAVVKFARRNRAWLTETGSAFFSVGLAILSRTSDGRAETQKVIDTFAGKTGWCPARTEMVAGALLYTKYNFFVRWVMQRIVAKAGGDTDTSRDYEYTDWGEVGRLAKSFAQGLRARATPAEKEENRAEDSGLRAMALDMH